MKLIYLTAIIATAVWCSTSLAQTPDWAECSMDYDGVFAEKYGNKEIGDPATASVVFRYDKNSDSNPGEADYKGYATNRSVSKVTVSDGTDSAEALIIKVIVGLDTSVSNIDIVSLEPQKSFGKIAGIDQGWDLPAGSALKVRFRHNTADYLTDTQVPSDTAKWLGFDDRYIYLKNGSDRPPRRIIEINNITSFSCNS